MSFLTLVREQWPACRRLVGAVTGVCLVLILGSARTATADAEDDFALARNLYRDAGDWATAAQLFAEFIAHHPGNPNLPEARLMLGYSYARSDHCEGAVRAFADFYQEHPEHLSVAEARRARARCLTELGQYRAAALALEEVQRLFSASEFAPEALLEAAANHRRAADFASTARLYRRAIDEYPTHPAALTARYHLAQLVFAQGDGDGALALLEEIDATAPTGEQARDALLLSQRIHLIRNHGAAARRLLDQLLERFPDTAHADSGLVDIAEYHFARGRFDEAVSVYQQAAERPSSASGWKDHVRLGLADALRESGQFERAVQMYEKVMSQSGAAAGTLASARLGLAITHSRTGRAGEAVPIFLGLIQSHSRTTAASSAASRSIWATAVRELAALYRRQGEYTRSSVWYDEYLAEADRLGADFPEPPPRQEWVRLQVAKLYDAAGQSDRAIQLFESLQNASPQLQPEIQRSLAEAHENAGKTSQALHAYRVFLERFPDHPSAPRVRDRIELLSEFTIRDADGLDAALGQSRIDELNGRSRRDLLLDLAHILRAHQDYDNAVRTYETFAASYPDDPLAAQAQFFLAECLLRLARKRGLTNETAQADSLRRLGLDEHRILAAAASPYARHAQLRLVEVGASEAPDSTRLQVLESGLSSFLSAPSSVDSGAAVVPMSADTRARALLLLGDTRRQLAHEDAQILDTALAAYEQLLQLAPSPAVAARGRFGRALCLAGLGRDDIVDSLQALLNQQAGRSLVPEILFELGHALIADGKPLSAIARFRELLSAYPAYPKRRAVQEELAATYVRQRRYDLAIRQYQQLLSSEPRPEHVLELQRRLALAHHAAGYRSEALDLYTTMLGAVAQSAGADSLAFNRGRLLVELGQLEAALQAFDDLHRRYPSSALSGPARIEAADLLFDLERYEAAHKAYAPLLDKGAPPRLGGRAAVALYRLDRLDQARKLGKRADDRVWRVLLRLEEGRLHLRRGEHERAQKLFAQIEKEVRDKPLEVGEFSERDADLADMAAAPAAAAAYYLATSRWEQNEAQPSEEGLAIAMEAQRRFLNDYAHSPQAVDVHLRLGYFKFYTLDTYLMAAGDFSRVLEAPAAPLHKRQDAIWMLFNCYLKVHEWADAQRLAARLLTEFPDHPKTNVVQLRIGDLLIEQGQYAQAIEHLESILSWAQGDDAAEARFHIGRAYHNRGEYRKAIKAYYEVRYFGADAFAAWITTADYERAACHEELGENPQAESIYQEIIEREGSDSEFGGEARKRLIRLRAPAE